MKLFKLLILILTLVFFSNSIFAKNIQIQINESTQATEESDGQVTIQTSGLINITNPTNQSLIYEYGFEFRTDVYFSFQSTNSDFIVSSRRVQAQTINPNDSIQFNYTLNGKIPKYSYNDLISKDTSVIQWYSNEIYFDPLRFASLSKFSRQNASETNISERNIEISGINPTEFNVKLKNMNLYKTNTTNYLDFYKTENIIQTYENISINPQETFSFLYQDLYSDDMSIYWIEYDVETKNSFNISKEIHFTPFSRNKGSSPGHAGPSDEIFKIPDNLLFSKITNQSLIKPGDTIEISLIIQNLNNQAFYDLSILDFIPDNFGFAGSSKLKNLSFYISNISKFETKRITYPIKYISNTTPQSIYVPRAKLNYNSKIVTSNPLNLIGDDDPIEKKISIIKQIDYKSESEIEVTIIVKNLGNIDLTDLYIYEGNDSVDFTNETSIKKNSWKIPSLKVNEEWVVKYTLTNNEVTNSIPELYGVSNAKVYKTIITNPRIESKIELVEVPTYQKVIVGLAALLLFIDVVF